MNESGPRRIPPDQSSGSGHTIGTSRHPNLTDLIPSKRVCFYKSGDPQFNGLNMVINNRTFKTFDALLDSLSKKVPLPFGVRNITTPRGVHAVRTLDELEDGKSYICSDKRKVKPINLALASKKLPPWYHARPVSARRQAVQLARFSPGRATHKQEPVAVRTPKKLLVFRNGDPSVRHAVLLQKRTTPTFESLLAFISELMQFHVVKLHTPDGRRVDGLPALILCSGTVVAAGREPFRSANYNVQKAPAPTWQPTKPMGPRRLKAVNRKQKSISSISKARNFSLSSERYIVNRIQSSIADSLCDLPSNPTDSVELETGRILESVAETEDGETPEDDIEKSFRVNQDGSMTVEMRVRLTIKEEETVHWTTTLSRSSVANQRNTTCLPEPEPESLSEQESVSPKSNPLDSQNPTASADRKESKDDDDNDPPSLDKGIASESGNEEENDQVQMDAASPRRAPTPGPRRIRTKQTSMESVKSVMAEEIQEGMVGSYSYREETENGAVTEQYCMVKQSSSRPVPKPRGLGSMDANTVKSAGMAEILQIEAGGEKVTETVLHIYEQQTCQDNFHADSHFCAQGLSMSGILYGRPATSGTACFSSNYDFETELGRPSTASESISIWRAESMSLTDFTLPSLKAGADYTSPQEANQGER
ncbi:oxygen-regulated protein 1-like [Centroberyx affinis]|uniref:oxygen-regulated protein 1-like n=1 Tax=Centroberyx affinis TaxID=166261 RepID=UPI003A5C43FF